MEELYRLCLLRAVRPEKFKPTHYLTFLTIASYVVVRRGTIASASARQLAPMTASAHFQVVV